MTELERDRITRLEIEVKHLSSDVEELSRKIADLMPLKGTVSAMTRALWMVAGVIATGVVGTLIAFTFRGGFSLGVGP